MWAERSRTSSRAPGTASAIASEAAGGQIRSCAPARTRTGLRTPRSAASTSGTAIAAGRGGAQHVGRVDGGGHRVAQVADARVARVGEVERQLVGQERRDVLRRADLGLARPRALHLRPEVLGLEARELVVDAGQPALRRRPAGDHGAGVRGIGRADEVRQGDEGPEGVAQHHVALELQRRRQRRHVGGHARDGPGLRGRRLGAALGALVDEEEPVVVGDGIQPPAELGVVQARPAVQRDHPERPGSALLDVQAGVADVDEAGHRPRVPGARLPTGGL